MDSVLEPEPEIFESDEKPLENLAEENRSINEYFKEYDDTDPADELFNKNPAGVDNSEILPNNSEAMDRLATFASFSWAGPDKHLELISHAWRKAVIVILVVMAFLALLWQGSILTAITFFALAVVTSMHFWREVREERYEIQPHGIMAGGEFHHYHDLDSFWIHYHPEGYHELSLCTGKLLNHYIKVSLKGQDPLEIREALMQYLPEKRHEEGLEDWLRRKLGL